jgi:Tat protein secretion system quality control protein TatD with DNase activity
VGASFIDSHCHIAGPEFADDLDAVIARALAAGVTHALVILGADDQPEIEQARTVAAKWNGVRFSIGVHPHAAGKFATDPGDAARAVGQAMDEQPLTITTTSHRGTSSRPSSAVRSRSRVSAACRS